MALILNTITSLSFLTSLPRKLSLSPPKLASLQPCLNFAVFQELKNDDEQIEAITPPKKKRLSEQSSWEAKDSKGNDYLYRLGAEADNMNIAVGARSGVVDDLFTGNFLGKDSDIVFDYRQKVTRSFQYLQGDYYIAPLFLV
ncbi:hypothetical protein KSS87_008930 [Heliosperma pusillum]|nr:hypothetical protein KSS87_008930 [Heliosperma pusillum]